MGDVISKAATGVGGVVGNAVLAPFKAVFNASCDEVCAGPWDFLCFVENLCINNLIKLLMILGLCYIILLFCYLLFKVGICQCIGRSLCKMCWGACRMYWYALEDIACFCWRKLITKKRRNRRRIRDIEIGYSSSDGSFSSDRSGLASYSRKRFREIEKQYGDGAHHRRHHHHHSSTGGSSRRLRNSRPVNARHHPHKTKRRRL